MVGVPSSLKLERFLIGEVENDIVLSLFDDDADKRIARGCVSWNGNEA